MIRSMYLNPLIEARNRLLLQLSNELSKKDINLDFIKYLKTETMVVEGAIESIQSKLKKAA